MRYQLISFLCLSVLLLGGAPLAFEPDAETKENIAAALWLNEYDPAAIPPDIISRIESEKNSNAAFGERMRWNLSTMLANPDSFTPDYTELYTTFMEHAGELSPHQAYGMANSLGLDSSRDYQEIPPEITFEFPRDDRPWFEYQCGWHFFVGSVFAESGQEFGVQMMFWTQSVLPPERAHSLGLSDIENQMAEMHFAISRAGDTHHRAQPTLVAGTTGLITFSSSPFNFSLGKNSMRSLSSDTLFPLELRAWGVDRTGESPVEIEIHIVLKQKKGYVLNGEGGLAPSCGGLGTLYTSVTNLAVVPDQSWLKVKGHKYRLAKGKMWYDHQWATGFQPPGNVRSEPMRAAKNLEPRKPDGWDWFDVQFDDNTEFTISALHTAENSGFYNQSGPEPPGTMVSDAWGLYVDRAGAYTPITGKVTVREWVKSARSQGPYQATGIWYPNRADITIDDSCTSVPKKKRAFSMVPIVNNGQQGFFAAGFEYSEGAAYIKRNGKRIGRGFMEAPGYDLGLKLSLRIAGLPDTDEMIDMIRRSQVVSPELKAQSQEFIDIPENRQQLIEDFSACKAVH